MTLVLIIYSSIKLPVAALVEQFKANANTPLIRHFDLLYIQTGIRRMTFVESAALFPVVLQSVASAAKTSSAHGAQMFNLLLQLLKYFQLPPRGTKEDEELRASLQLSADDTSFLAFWFGRTILFSVVKSGSNTPSVTCPGLRPSEYAFLTLQNKDDVWNPTSPMGLNLFEIKSSVYRCRTDTPCFVCLYRVDFECRRGYAETNTTQHFARRPGFYQVFVHFVLW
jgi:proteasome component ECM29